MGRRMTRAVNHRCNACEYGPCVLNANNATVEADIYDGGGIIHLDAEECPFGMDLAKFKALPATDISMANLAFFEDWYFNDGVDYVPEKLREIIDGIECVPFGQIHDKALKVLCFIQGMDDGVYSRSELNELLKKFSKQEVLAGVSGTMFRFGMLYSLYVMATMETPLNPETGRDS